MNPPAVAVPQPVIDVIAGARSESQLATASVPLPPAPGVLAPVEFPPTAPAPPPPLPAWYQLPSIPLTPPRFP